MTTVTITLSVLAIVAVLSFGFMAWEDISDFIARRRAPRIEPKLPARTLREHRADRRAYR